MKTVQPTCRLPTRTSYDGYLSKPLAEGLTFLKPSLSRGDLSRMDIGHKKMFQALCERGLMWCAICVPSIREVSTVNSSTHRVDYNAFMRGLRTKDGQESVAANKGTKGDLFKLWMDPSCRIRNKGALESKPGGLLYETSALDKPTKITFQFCGHGVQIGLSILGRSA